MGVGSTGALAAVQDCTVLLVRHSHIEMAGRFCGHTDPALSDTGRAQLGELVARLTKYPVTQIFSSDLRRASETARAIAEASEKAVTLRQDLREIRFGEWDGLNWEQVSKRDAEYAERWIAEYPLLRAPGGEDFKDFRSRVQHALNEIAVCVVGGCAVVVTHGGVIRTLMLDVLNLPESSLAAYECEYASCTEVRLRDGRWMPAIELAPEANERPAKLHF